MKRSTQQVIEKVFEENSQSLLYRDNQLLKEGNYREVASRLLKKYSRLYGFYLSFAALFFVIGVYYLNQFIGGSGRGDLYLFTAYFTLTVVKLFFSTREYYSIKSSLSFILSLVDKEHEKEEAEPAGHISGLEAG